MANKFFEWINKVVNDIDDESGNVPNVDGNQDVDDTSTPINEQHSEQQEVNEQQEAETPPVEEPIKSDVTPEEYHQDTTPKDTPVVEPQVTPVVKPIEKKTPVQKNMTEEPQLPAVKGNNAIEKRENLVQLIISQVKRDYRGVEVSLQECSLVITLTDGVLFTIVNNDEFVSQLRQKIVNECGCNFGKIVIKNSLPQEHHGKVLAQDVYYEVTMQQVTPDVNGGTLRARITAMQGSLKTPEVILDSEEIRRLNNACYNIGAMSQPYPTRINQIAIDESDDAQSQYNQYASREHAHIAYNERDGFLLYADRGGIRESYKRTHIIRNNQEIEVEGTIVPKALRDGDVIALSRKVYLKFEIIS